MPAKRSSLEFMESKQGNDKKASKPLIEKRRRARINHSLAQLKTLVVDPGTTENSRQAKLEKADILEITVKHLRDIKNLQNSDSSLNPKQFQRRFEMGYAECSRQVELFLENSLRAGLPDSESDLRRRLREHLSRIARQMRQPDPDPPRKPSSAAISVIVSSQAHAQTLLGEQRPDTTHERPTRDSQRPESSGDAQFLPVHPRSPKDSEQIPKVYHRSPTKPEQIPTVHPRSSAETESVPGRRSRSPDSDGCRNGACSSDPWDGGSSPRLISPEGAFDSRADSSSSWQSSPALKPPAPGRLPDCHESRESPSSSSDFYCHQDRAGSVGPEAISSSSSSSLSRSPDSQTVALTPRRLPNGDWALVFPGHVALVEGGGPAQGASAFRLVSPPATGCPEAVVERRRVAPAMFGESPPPPSGTFRGHVGVSGMFENSDFKMDCDECVWRPW